MLLIFYGVQYGCQNPNAFILSKLVIMIQALRLDSIDNESTHWYPSLFSTGWSNTSYASFRAAHKNSPIEASKICTTLTWGPQVGLEHPIHITMTHLSHQGLILIIIVL